MMETIPHILVEGPGREAGDEDEAEMKIGPAPNLADHGRPQLTAQLLTLLASGLGQAVDRLGS